MQAFDRYVLGPFEIRPDQNLIAGPGGKQHIEPKAMAVLLELIAAGSRTVSRRQLIDRVWPRGFVTDDALNGCIAQLRRALGDHAHDPRFIETVPKLGYRLMQACVPAEATNSPLAPTKRIAATGPDLQPAATAPPLHGRFTRTFILTLTGVLLIAAIEGWFVLHDSGTLNAHAVARSGTVKSVAVLPFKNLSQDKQNAFFAQGVQDEILADLSRMPGLKIISRTSVMKYDSRSGRSMRDIARTLDVHYVIKGSVQREGDSFRIAAQLIDARRAVQLWGGTFDRKTADVFAIESEIAAEIANQLEIRISPVERASIMRAPTSDLVAYELYDRARNIRVWNDSQDASRSLKKMVALLEHAIQRDPNFALAYCAMAKALDLLSIVGADHDAYLAKAKQAVDTALHLRPDLGEAHLELGRFFFYTGQYDRSYEELLMVNRKWPNTAEAYRLMGDIDRIRNRWDDALDNFQKAYNLDPRNGEYVHHLQQAYLQTRRYVQGIRFIQDAFQRDQQYPLWQWLYLAQYKLAEGDPKGASEELTHVPLNFSPTSAFWSVRVRTALYLRDYGRASRILAVIPKKWVSGMYSGIPPDSLENGIIERLRGHAGKAHAIFVRLRSSVRSKFAEKSDDEPLILEEEARLDAELGYREKAIREALRSIHLASGTYALRMSMILNLAHVYTLAGKRKLAIQQLESIADDPLAPTYGDLRYDPDWDSLRGTPRFQQLIARIKPPAKP